MTTRRTIMLFASMALAAPSAAMAQTWGHGSTPRAGVCFYKDPGFEGEYFCAAAGENRNRLPSGMNDKISSIRIFGNTELTVFKDVQFEGRSLRFTADVRNLKNEGWNDLISSFRVRGGGYGHAGSLDDPDRVVRRAYEDILDREPDQAGLRLYRSRIIDDGWTEADVRDALRKSPEYREKNTITVPKAQEIVRKAYLNVLKREPDAGSRSYVDKILKEKWTQEDVERELRKSAEYRGRGGQ